MASSGLTTTQAGPGGPKPAPLPLQSERVEHKKDLSSWWKGFSKRGDKKGQDIQGAFEQVRRCSCPTCHSPQGTSTHVYVIFLVATAIIWKYRPSIRAIRQDTVFVLPDIYTCSF